MNLSIWFESLKRSVSVYSGFSQDALHIHIGLAIFVCLVLVLKRKPMTAIIIVLMIALAGEALDYFRLYSWGMPYPHREGIGDVLNTIFWPLLLTICHYRKNLPISPSALKKNPT